MELLCLLPVAHLKADGATFPNLMQDLGFLRQAEMLVCFRMLSEKYALTKYTHLRVKRMAITPAGWHKARPDGQRYWDTVYGNSPTTPKARAVGAVCDLALTGTVP